MTASSDSSSSEDEEELSRLQSVAVSGQAVADGAAAAPSHRKVSAPVPSMSLNVALSSLQCHLSCASMLCPQQSSRKRKAAGAARCDNSDDSGGVGIVEDKVGPLMLTQLQRSC